MAAAPAHGIQRTCPACEDEKTHRKTSDSLAPAGLLIRFPVSLAIRTLVQREPFEPVGPDNAHCRDEIADDGATCADHANTTCSVTGAGFAGSGMLIGAGIGSMIAPGAGTLVGGAVDGLMSGIGGAYAYGVR